VDINMVFFTVPKTRDSETARRVMAQLQEHGILANAPEEGVFRFVTHYWITDQDVSRIIETSRRIFA